MTSTMLTGQPVLLVDNFLSREGGGVSVCEDLAELFSASGWPTIRVSDKRNRLFRLVDMAGKVILKRGEYGTAVVHVYSGQAFIWAEVVSALLKMVGKPFVLALHGGNLPLFSRRWPRRVRRLLRSAPVVVTPSTYLQEQLKGYCDEIRLLPNALAIDRYRYRLRNGVKPRLLWLRAFHAIYNPSLAASVVAKLVKEFPDIKLTMVGPDKRDGSLQATQAKSSELGVEGHMEFPGKIAKEHVPLWLERYDVFLNTSNIDNTPMSVIEALACGLCVVSTNVGGIPYLLKDGEDALLVPPDDAEAMAQAVKRILTDKELAMQLSRNGRKKVEQFNWGSICHSWEMIMDNLGKDTIQGGAMPPRTDSNSILFVGNYLSSVGVISQSEALANHLGERGWKIFMTSTTVNPVLRICDMMGSAWRLRRSYWCAQVDVFSGAAFVWSEAVCALLRLARKPYILTLRGGNLPAFTRKWPRRVRRLLESAAIVTTPSQYLQKQLPPFRGRIELVPNPLDVSRYRNRVRNGVQARLVWLRAFHKLYNPVLAVRALGRLVSEYPDITLTMVGRDKGDGSFQVAQSTAAQLGILDHVQFPGKVAKEDVPQWLDPGDIFINTSNVDNTPVSVMEAMASGMCVVSTNVGGMTYLLKDGVDALLVPPDDAEAMAHAVKQILSDKNLAERLSRNARAKAEEFDWPIILALWERLFGSLRS